MASLRWARARKVEALRVVRLFASCSRRELGQVADVGVASSVPAGTVLTREGHAGGLAYVIVAGSCEVLRAGRRVARLWAGDVVGELSLLDGGPRTATVRTVSDAELLEIAHRDLQALLRKAPDLRRSVLQALAERIRDVDSRATTVA